MEQPISLTESGSSRFTERSLEKIRWRMMRKSPQVYTQTCTHEHVTYNINKLLRRVADQLGHVCCISSFLTLLSHSNFIGKSVMEEQNVLHRKSYFGRLVSNIAITPSWKTPIVTAP